MTNFERLVLSALVVLVRLAAARHEGRDDLKSMAARVITVIDSALGERS